MTTRRMEDFFNIPSAEDTEEVEAEVVVDSYASVDKSQIMAEATEVYTAMTMADKIDIALPTVSDLSQHDKDMDDISKKAIKSFEDLILLGGNVPDLHAGKIFEVASTMLKTALEAKNAKAEKKLRIIELQLKKARLDQIDTEMGGGAPSKGGEFDRNELMKYIMNSAKTDE